MTIGFNHIQTIFYHGWESKTYHWYSLVNHTRIPKSFIIYDNFIYSFLHTPIGPIHGFMPIKTKAYMIRKQMGFYDRMTAGIAATREPQLRLGSLQDTWGCDLNVLLVSHGGAKNGPENQLTWGVP